MSKKKKSMAEAFEDLAEARRDFRNELLAVLTLDRLTLWLMLSGAFLIPMALVFERPPESYALAIVGAVVFSVGAFARRYKP